MPKILSNGIQLHYEEMGSGPETIVFSHSYLADHYHFNPQMQALKDRYRCIAFDHRGHGQSEIPDDGYGMENLYEDAVGFIEALDCAPCHFVGLSTGGFIGVRIGIRHSSIVHSRQVHQRSIGGHNLPITDAAVGDLMPPEPFHRIGIGFLAIGYPDNPQRF